MTWDAQSTTDFGGQLRNVAFPGKIMADCEDQKQKDFIKRIVEKVDGAVGGGFPNGPFRRDMVRV